MVGVASLALLGLIYLQVMQIRKAIELTEENFNTSVNDALNQLVDRLYAENVSTSYVKIIREIQVANPNNRFEDEQLAAGREPTPDLSLSIGVEETDSLNERRVRIRDSYITEQETTIPSDSLGVNTEEEIAFFFEGDGDSLTSGSGIRMPADPQMLRVMSQTMRDIRSQNLRIEDRIDPRMLDSLLQVSLEDQGIYLGYEYVVDIPSYEKILFHSEEVSMPHLMDSRHKVQLFPYLGLKDKSYLYVGFPNQEIFALKSVWRQAVASLLFSGIILFCFWWTIRTILRQKKLSEMTTDFINNMTHELKTPLATISVAADALKNPRVQQEAAGMARYIGIIKEENQRMNRQVERVLQAARFERKQIGLKKETIDAHLLIEKAARHVDLQVQEREGQLEMDLEAERFDLNADPVHFNNMVYNLLDNANKYSPDAPHIRLHTYNQGNELVIAVSDQGKGISKSDQGRIFTRFFRVSTGNLHDVKGFGLGLSYVQETMEAHGGSVSVRSNPGKGSTFVLRFPLEAA